MREPNTMTIRLATATVLAALLLLTGCASSSQNAASSPATATGGSGSAGSGNTAEQVNLTVLNRYLTAMVSYADCLRENGVPNTGPDAFGEVIADNSNGDAATNLNAALKECRSLDVPLPAAVMKMRESRQLPPIDVAEAKVKKDYAACMKSSGAPDFPDVLPNGYFSLKDWAQESAGGQEALAACAWIVGGGAPTSPGLG